MGNSRLALLEQFYKEEPNDPFNIYALALEYLKTEPGKARDLFLRLLSHHETYLPTYYHAALLFQEMMDKELATQTYEKGISLARKLGDHKAERELKSALDEMNFE